MFASSHCTSVPGVAVVPLGARLRALSRAFGRRPARIDLAGLSVEMKRDLGFADGRPSLPRNPLRD